MSILAGAGISVTLPPGWEGGIDEGGILDDGAVRESVTHVANFPLPPVRGDYGGGAVNLMQSGDALVILLEFARASAATPLFKAEGLPRSLVSADFSRDTLQRRIEGQGGVQRFFHESGRAFCLYVVVGSYIDRADVLPGINSVLGSMVISP